MARRSFSLEKSFRSEKEGCDLSSHGCCKIQDTLERSVASTQGTVCSMVRTRATKALAGIFLCTFLSWHAVLAFAPPQTTSTSSSAAASISSRLFPPPPSQSRPLARRYPLPPFSTARFAQSPPVVDDDKLSLVLNSFSLLRTIGQKVFPSNATTTEDDDDDDDKPAFSLHSFPIFERRRARWCSNPAFKRLTAWAFEVCDAEHSKAVDKSELYAGILLVHLQIARYAGVAACHPPGREQIYDLFDLIDWQRTGYLNEEDFTDIVVVCVRNVP